MCGLLIMSCIAYFVLLYFSPLAMTCDDYDWVPRVQDTVSAQCIAKDYPGNCELSSLYVHFRRIEYGLCKHLLCAKPRRDKYVAVSIGAAAVGTVCGPYRVCNPEKQYVQIPTDKMPRPVGLNNDYDCVHEYEEDLDK